MCGIAGIVSLSPIENGLPLLQKMGDSLAHRGPDGQGFWLNDALSVGLAHRRLAIIDTSELGKQPMHYKNRYSITFNGMIYNYIELKKELQKQGHIFNSQSDTEVVLALYDQFGTACLSHLDGMFAFAIYDDHNKELFCARDRFGEKPFYYNHVGTQFIFGSEMKALWAAGVPKVMNPTMHYNYLAYGFLKNPLNLSETFFKDTFELPHAHYLLYDIQQSKLIIKKYFELYYASENANGSDFYLHKEHSKLAQTDGINHYLSDLQQLHSLFHSSLTYRMRSDVPIGCSLSGGLDSGIIATALQQQLGQEPLNTFSAVFPGYKKDESSYIKELVNKIGIQSYTTTPSIEEYRNEKEKFLHHQEEPVVDDSPFILYKVYELAKKHNIKVLLDGQGADEVFAGYHAYFFTYLKELKRTKNMAYHEEYASFKMLVKQNIINDYGFFKRQQLLANLLGEKLTDIRIWKQKWDQFKSAKIDKSLYKAEHMHSFKRKYVFNSLNEHLHHDAMQGKLQTLLRYADRSAMAHGVEIRLPYLNHQLVEFAFRLPATYKIHKGFTKYLLRNMAIDYYSKMPLELIERKDKIGAEGELR